MALDLDLNKDVAVGRWKLGKLTAGMIEDIADWLRPKVQAEVELVKSTLQFLAPEAAAAKVEECVALMRQVDGLSMESTLSRAFLRGTSAGQMKVLHLRMLAFAPTATADDAYQLYHEIGERAKADAAAAKADAAAEAAPEPAPNLSAPAA